MPYGLSSEAIEKIISVLRRDTRIRHVWLYGSRSRGTERTGSDIDLCLDAPQLNLTDVFALEAQLEELTLPWKIDISLLHKQQDASLLHSIRHDGIDLLAYTSEPQSDSISHHVK